MADANTLIQAVVEMQEQQAMALTRQLVADGVGALNVFDAYKKALQEVGERFEKQVYFIPELIMAGNMMKSALEIIKPHLGDEVTEGGPQRGKFLIATVEGDIHDIGKNMVSMLMEINGFQVLDLGVDVPVQKIVSEAKAFGADIVGLSGLLTLAFDPMREVVASLAASGLRDKVKVIVGGGQLDERVLKYVGADAFATDAVTGINICTEWMS